MNPLVVILLRHYKRRLTYSTNESKGFKHLQHLMFTYLCEYKDCIRRSLNINDARNYEQELNEIHEEMEKYEILLLEILSELLEKL